MAIQKPETLIITRFGTRRESHVHLIFAREIQVNLAHFISHPAKLGYCELRPRIPLTLLSQARLTTGFGSAGETESRASSVIYDMKRGDEIELLGIAGHGFRLDEMKGAGSGFCRDGNRCRSAAFGIAPRVET